MACSGCRCSTCRNKTHAIELARANIRKLRKQIKVLKKEVVDWRGIADQYFAGLAVHQKPPR
jgi:hypothetical protein